MNPTCQFLATVLMISSLTSERIAADEVLSPLGEESVKTIRTLPIDTMEYYKESDRATELLI